MTLPDGPTDHVDTEVLLRRVLDIVTQAKAIPLSTTVRLENKEEVVELLEEAIKRLPDELRRARWLLKEREEFLSKVQREGDAMLDDARARAERMVQRTEIVREAQRTAQSTVDASDEEGRRLRNEAEDYCDQKLAAFEIILERTMKTVQAGREKLQVTPIAAPPEAHAGLESGAGDDDGGPTTGEQFFDQDHS